MIKTVLLLGFWAHVSVSPDAPPVRSAAGQLSRKAWPVTAKPQSWHSEGWSGDDGEILSTRLEWRSSWRKNAEEYAPGTCDASSQSTFTRHGSGFLLPFFLTVCSGGIRKRWKPTELHKQPLILYLRSPPGPSDRFVPCFNVSNFSARRRGAAVWVSEWNQCDRCRVGVSSAPQSL